MTTTFDYAAASMAAYRHVKGEASPSDVEVAADFDARNEYVRREEAMVSFASPDFSQGGGALLIHPNRVDDDAGQQGSIGTADGRVVHTSDTTVTTTVYDIATRKPHQVTYVIPGGIARKGRNSATNGRKGGRPRKPDHELTPAALRKRRQRERERTSTLAIAEARPGLLKNLSAELVDA